MYKYLLLFILCATIIQAQVTINGDARVRPRYDINDKTPANGTKTSDFYYMYRARLNLNADIGEGWKFHTLISHNGIFYYSTFNTGDFPDILGTDQNPSKPTSRQSSRRASLSFMELYFGQETETYNFKVGLFPLGSINNPIYDLHYYPNKMVDIPYAIFNTDGAFGFAGNYKTSAGTFGAKLIIEDAKGKEEEAYDGTILSDKNDQMTFELNYAIPVSGFTLAPMALISISSQKDSMCKPNTFGLNITTPKLGEFTLQGTAAISSQDNKDLKSVQGPGYPVSKYSGYLLRLKMSGKLGPGNLVAWFDYAQLTEKQVLKDVDYGFAYFWVNYEIPIYKSEKGAVSITPELRYAKYYKESEHISDRIKMEVNFDIKF